jgi:hypothetical protein
MIGRVRVISNGQVVGSLPSHNGRGYTGADCANYQSPKGALWGLRYVCYWVDEAGNPLAAGATAGFQAPTFLLEYMLEADGFDAAALSVIEGWQGVDGARPKTSTFDLSLIARSS